MLRPVPYQSLVQMRGNQPRIDFLGRRHHVGGQCGKLCRRRIAPGLDLVAGAGDDDGDGFLGSSVSSVSAKAAMEAPCRHQLAHLVDRLEADLEGHAGEGLADIEGARRGG